MGRTPISKTNRSSTGCTQGYLQLEIILMNLDRQGTNKGTARITDLETQTQVRYLGI